jgi:hypothetical protein
MASVRSMVHSVQVSGEGLKFQLGHQFSITTSLPFQNLAKILPCVEVRSLKVRVLL